MATRYTYQCEWAKLIAQDILANARLSPSAIETTAEPAVSLDFLTPLSEFQKDSLDQAMDQQCFMFVGESQVP